MKTFKHAFSQNKTKHKKTKKVYKMYDVRRGGANFSFQVPL